MCQIALSIPDEVLYDTKMSHEQANQFARQSVALAYYTQSGVSIGYCSRIAGMTEEEFIKYWLIENLNATSSVALRIT